jgi:hypothetical protein
MEKPWWLHLTGSVTLASATLLGVGIAISPSFFMKPVMLPVFVAWATVTVALFMTWVSIIGMIWVANRTARSQAAITFEVLANLVNKMQGQPAAAAESPVTSVWDNPPTGIICDGCKRPHAMLYCKKHKATLCFPCTGNHDAENCLYIAADRHTQRSKKQTIGTKTMGRVLGI